jgi:ornithine cyclodeaminase
MARFFVDFRGSAMAQAGELLHAIRSGRVTESHIVGEIGEVLSGATPGRRTSDEITVYKSLGVAAQDLAAGMFVHRCAVERAQGTVAPI